MLLAPDKITHLKGGLLALLGAAVLALLGLVALGLHPLTVALAVAGAAAGAAVEAAQHALNRAAQSQGLPPPHEVSLADLVASAAPCWLAALAVEWLSRAGLLEVLMMLLQPPVA